MFVEDVALKYEWTSVGREQVNPNQLRAHGSWEKV
jgi:hypothetical protein